MATITGTVTNEVTLGTGTYTSPLTIAGTAAVSVSSIAAIYGPNTQAWTVANYGTVFNSGSFGVELLNGGSVANTGTALIQGYDEGIYIAGSAGTVTNSGTIRGTSAFGFPVDLTAGGTVDNSGMIRGGIFAVEIAGSAGTVTNTGTIIGDFGPGGAGVYLRAGGSIGNTTAGLIEGGVTIAGVGTVTNSGYIVGHIRGGVVLGGGGSVNNSGTIDNVYGVAMGGLGTLTNSGTILGNIGDGVALRAGGYVDNSGTIQGATGVYITSGTAIDSGTIVASVTNSGTGLIQGNTGVSITGAAGTVTNSATIIGTSGDGVYLKAGGIVNNSGTIQGLSDFQDVGVYIAGSAGTLINSGVISAVNPAGRGVYLAAGGSVNNSGTIQGFVDFGDTGGGAGTLTNSGTILGNDIDLFAGGSIENMAGLIGGRVEINGSGGSVINLARMISPAVGPVISLVGGSIYNSGTISGAGAIDIGAGTVTNFGTILGAIAGGIRFNAGGSIANMAGLLQGGGVVIAGSAGTVTNLATIINEIDLRAGGYVGNSGTIQGRIYITGAAGTVIDSGTIVGGGTAVSFGGTAGGSGSNLLVLEAGYYLSGKVLGSTTVGATNTLELSGTLGTVTATYNTLGLSNFQDVLFGAGGSETLKATNTTGTLGTVTLSGWTQTSDILDLTAVGTNATLANGGTVNGAHQLTASGSGGTVVLQLDATDGTVFTAASDLGTGINVTPACFCRGALILTERGEAAVEDLAIGDKVVTLSGALRAVKWIGRRAYDGRFVAANRAVLPIRVAAGALAPGLPARDLWLSPEHALYIDGALVPVGLLVNGATIRQAASVDRLEYFHIELERHDVILAEGAPVETFVDCDSRGIFQNAGEFAELYPDDSPIPWDFCAPRAEEGSAELAAIRAALAERSAIAPELKLAS
jgi:hypothetical protein